jgi:hypothetical protein
LLGRSRRGRSRGTVSVIGYLTLGSPENSREAAFRKALSETGYVEGRNVTRRCSA